MANPRLPGIPSPQPTLDSLMETALALKQAVEILMGVYGDGSRSARRSEITDLSQRLDDNLAQLAADFQGDVEEVVEAMSPTFAGPVEAPGFTSSEDIEINRDGDAASAQFIMDTDDGYNRLLRFRSNGLERWDVRVNSVAESGAGAGSDLTINRYSDAGAFVDTALQIVRATGQLRISYEPTIGGVALLTYISRREKLSANRTYYVRTDGSDSNTGLADTAGGAFLTIQKAMDVIAELDIATYNVTVNVRAGTYTSTLNLRTVVGSGTVSFIGDETTPSNVAITPASGRAINSITYGAIGNFVIAGFKLTGASTNDVILGSRIRVTLRACEYAGTSSYRIQVYNFAYLSFTGTAHLISGGGSGFILCLSFGYVEMFSNTFTFTASVTYAVAFAVALQLGFINSTSCTFTLGAFTVTGSRYSVSINAVISSGGGGASYFPGTSGGATATGGQYT